MGKKRKTLAGRLTRTLLVWLLVILAVLSYFVFRITEGVTREYYSESYHNKMLITNEYTRRVLSDVYVAVTNNIYYLEQNLSAPDSHKDVMERIVRNGTRVRSCGISFVKDYYYPQKGHHFCPYAWRSPVNPDVIYSEDMGDTALDYLEADWFLDVIKSDSAQWSDPFYDGHDSKTPLTAYMSPIHDKEGNVVAVIGADVSLDWLTDKLNETDSTINEDIPFGADYLGLTSSSFIINHDGTFITHPDVERILKDNFFNHIDRSGNTDSKTLAEKMKAGMVSEKEIRESYSFDGNKCYVFYTPVKYTQWMIVTVVPWQSIDVLAISIGIIILLVMALVMLAIIGVCHNFTKRNSQTLLVLASHADSMAKGKFDLPLPDAEHNDEIRQLRDSLDNMQYFLSNYVDEMKRGEK